MQQKRLHEFHKTKDSDKQFALEVFIDAVKNKKIERRRFALTTRATFYLCIHK